MSGSQQEETLVDHACIDSNKHKDKGQRDEAEHKIGPLCVSKAELGAEVIISDGCWVVDNLDNVTASKSKDECSLREKRQVCEYSQHDQFSCISE